MSNRRPPDRQDLTGLYAYVVGLIVAVLILDSLSKAIAGRSRKRSKVRGEGLTPVGVSLSNLGLGLVLATATTLGFLPEGGTGIEWTTDRAGIVGILFGFYLVGLIGVVRIGRVWIRQAVVEQSVTVMAGFGLAVLDRQPCLGLVLMVIALVIFLLGARSLLAREKRNAPRPSSPFEDTGDH